MSRTPLFRLLQRSYRAASYSIVAAEPVDEVLDRRDASRQARAAARDGGMSRRQFVAGSAAVAAVAALDACTPRNPVVTPTPRRDEGGPPVLIIGAGIAGLTAGYRLRQAGIPIRIIEAQNRVGGRMYSLRNFFADGQVCELGGELIDTPHERIQALAQELNIKLDDLSTDDPGLAHDTFYFDGAVRSEKDVVEAFVPLARRVAADTAPLGADPDVSYRDALPVAIALDRMSIAQWLDGAGVSGWFRKLLDVGYTTEYGLPTDRQSALNFLLMIDPSPDPFKIFGESDERYHVHEGNDLIVRTLGERLSDAIETNTVLESVDRRADGTYVCSLRRGSSSTTATSPHVVLATPFTLLRDVRLNVELPAAKKRAIAELGYGTNAKLMVGFSSRVWRERHKSNGSLLTDMPFQLTWETSRLQSGRAGILTNFTGGAHGVELGQGTAGEQATKLVADLERVFPGATAARAGMKEVRFHWPSFPWTRGSYASYLVGQWTAFGGAEGEAADGLHFAGEHCSRYAQGFMEGGCETGEQAAKQIAEVRGKRIGLRRAAPRRLMAAV
ncbi:MAG TPA: FAD-dependent oxidoreductase [Gemmatimonadaceae bacterium]|nr:FAD-dependent oxidoreductase [Gemmatimonadaceae bacterium]